MNLVVSAWHRGVVALGVLVGCLFAPSLFANPFDGRSTLGATPFVEEERSTPQQPRTFSIQGPDSTQQLQHERKPASPQPPKPPKPKPAQLDISKQDINQRDSQHALRALLAAIAKKQKLIPDIARQAQDQWQAVWYQQLVIEDTGHIVWSAVALGLDDELVQQLTRQQPAFPALSQRVTDLYLHKPYQQAARVRYQAVLAAMQAARLALQQNQHLEAAYMRLNASYQWFIAPRSTRTVLADQLGTQSSIIAPAATAKLFAMMARNPKAGSPAHQQLMRALEKQVATTEAQGDISRAIAWSHRLLKMDDSYQRNAQLARLYEQHNNAQAALYYLRRLHTMRPNPALSKHMLRLYMQTNQWQQAQSLVEAMRIRSPQDPDVRTAQARIDAAQGNWTQANDTYTSLLNEQQLTADMQTQWALQYIEQARAQQALGLLAQARDSLKQSVALMPTAQAYLQQAEVAQVAGNSNAMLASLVLAYQHNPTERYGRPLHAALQSYTNHLVSQQSKELLTPKATGFVEQLARLDTQYDAHSLAIARLQQQGRLSTQAAQAIARRYIIKAQQIQTTQPQQAQQYASTVYQLMPQSTEALKLLIALAKANSDEYSAIEYAAKLLDTKELRKTAAVSYANGIMRDVGVIVNRTSHKSTQPQKPSPQQKQQLISSVRTAVLWLQTNAEQARAQRLMMRLYLLPPVSEDDAKALYAMPAADLDANHTALFVDAARARFLFGDRQQAYNLMDRATALGDASVDGALVLLGLATTSKQPSAAVGVIGVLRQNGGVSAARARDFGLLTIRIAAQQQIVPADETRMLAEQIVPADEQQARLRTLAYRLTEQQQYAGAVLAFSLLPLQDGDAPRFIQALLGSGQSKRAYEVSQQTDGLAPNVGATILLAQSRAAPSSDKMRALLRQAHDDVEAGEFAALVEQETARALRQQRDTNTIVWLAEVVDVSKSATIVDIYKRTVDAALVADVDDATLADALVRMPAVVAQDGDFIQAAFATAFAEHQYQTAWRLLAALTPETLSQPQKHRYAADATQLAEILLQQDQYDNARMLLTFVVAFAPSVDALVRIGDIEYLQENLVAAYASWRRAAALDPNSNIAKARAQRLDFIEVFFAHQEDIDKTIKTLEAQTQERPNDDARKTFLSQLYDQKGQTAEQAQNQDAAKLAYKKALSYQPRVALLLRLARIAHAEQFWNEAIYYNLQAARQLPRQGQRYQDTQRALFSAYVQYANQFYEINRLGNAVLMLQKALTVAQTNQQLQLDEHTVHAQLSDYYTQLGNQAKAKFHAQQAGQAS